MDTIDTASLYRIARITRREVCTGPDSVARVIARPFTGKKGAFRRLAAARTDFSLPPPSDALPGMLQAAGIRTIGVGKVASLFCGRGFDRSIATSSNAHGIREILRLMRQSERVPTFVWANLIEFDELYGHRNDAHGFARALEEFDASIPELLGCLPPQGRLVIAADHGNDPTAHSTDHSREYVPLLYAGSVQPQDLGTRGTFADHAATVAGFFGLRAGHGTAFG